MQPVSEGLAYKTTLCKTFDVVDSIRLENEKKKNNESDFFCWEKHDDIRSGSVARKAKKCQKYKFGIKKFSIIWEIMDKKDWIKLEDIFREIVSLDDVGKQNSLVK